MGDITPRTPATRRRGRAPVLTAASVADPLALGLLPAAAAEASSTSEPRRAPFGPGACLEDLIETSGAVPGESLQSTHRPLIQTTQTDE